jgi:hypothetical protein
VKDITIDIYRYTQPLDNFSDPVWSFIGSFVGSKQPFTGDDGLHSNQQMENIRELIICYDMNLDLKKHDELKINGKFVRVAYIEIWDNDTIPHIEIFTTDSQWER